MKIPSEYKLCAEFHRELTVVRYSSSTYQCALQSSFLRKNNNN